MKRRTSAAKQFSIDTPPPDEEEESSYLAAGLLYVAALTPALASAFLLTQLPKVLGEQGGKVVEKALASATRGGIPGAISALVQIVLLMWLRTVTNYQYKYGGTMRGAMSKLYADGGVARFYQGWYVAASQVPISRFVDAAANSGMLELFAGVTWMPVALQTMVASGAAGAFRATLMPLDCIKTELQVKGPKAVPLLRKRFQREGPATFWRGTYATMLAAAVGHYPWFAVRNMLDTMSKETLLPLISGGSGTGVHPVVQLLVDACVGFAASVASDTVTNSIRVVKTRVQVSDDDPRAAPKGYAATVRDIVKESGWYGLFFTGLGTKAFTSALNGLIFNVIIKNFR